MEFDEFDRSNAHTFGTRFWRGVSIVLHRLGEIDPNPPHEGRLRNSVMPAEYLGVPDDISELTGNDSES